MRPRIDQRDAARSELPPVTDRQRGSHPGTTTLWTELWPVEVRRLPHRPAWRQFQLDAPEGIHQCTHGPNQIPTGREWRLGRKRIPQDAECFFLHRLAMRCGALPQTRVQRLVKIVDGQRVQGTSFSGEASMIASYSNPG